MLRNGIITIILGALAVLIMLMTRTAPATIHPSGILLFFVALYLLSASFFTLLVWLSSRTIAKLSGAVSNRSLITLGLRRAYIYGTVIAFTPVILLGMNSVGAIEPLDLGLVVVFEALVIFYVWRRT